MKRNVFRLGVAAAILVAAALAPAAAQVKSYRDIKYPKLPAFQIPKPVTFQLQNGMTVFLMEDRELPLISATARVRGGGYWDPADKTGLASLAGEVMRTGGTKSLPGDQMDELLAKKAASVETSVGDDAGFASMDCLKQDFDEVFRVFVDVLRNPAFPQDKLDLAKVQANTGIARRNDDVGGIAGRELRRLAYGPDSPMSRMEEYATIAAVTRDDLVAWHAKAVHPNNIFLGVVGDFDAKEMRQKIEAALAGWPKGPAFSEAAPAYRPTANPGVFFIEKSDVTQANVGMAHLGIEVKNPDYFAVQVMNEVLGGGFSARMFSNIRSKKGLAYNVGGGLGASFIHPGLMRASMQTKSQSVFDAIDAMKAEIRGIIDNPATDEELARAKEAILNSFVFNYDSKGKILAQQMTYAFYGLPADFLETYREKIEKVTKADVARVAKTYIKPDDLTVLVVGKAADFGKPLDTLGKVTTLDIAIPPPPDKGPKAVKSAASLAEGQKLLARASAALGGPNAGSVKALRSKGKMSINMGGQTMGASQTLTVVFPDKMRQTLQLPMGEQVMVISGGAGFAMFGGQVREIPAPMIEKAKQDLGRDLRFLVRYAGDAAIEAVAAGQDTADGAPCDLVAVTWSGTTSRLCVAGDGRVLKQSYSGENPLTRAPGNVEVLFSDYRAIDGRQVPGKETISVDGQKVIDLTLETFEVDPAIDPKDFEKP